MAVTVEVAGVDRTDKWIRNQGASWTDNLNGRGTGRIRFRDFVGGFRPQDGQVLLVKEDGTVRFAGILTSPEETEEEGWLFFQCTAYDLNAICDRRLVFAEYESMSFEAIVADIVTNFLSGEGISTADVQSGPTIDSISFNHVTVTEAFNRLATRTGYVWWIEYDGGTKVLNFRQKTAVSSPADMDGDTLLKGTVKVSEDRQRYRNVQIVKAGTEVFPILAEYIASGEVAARKAIEGGSGRYESIDEYKGIALGNTALAQAEDLVNRLGEIEKVVRGKTRTTGFASGQSVNVHLPEHDITNTTMVIDKVSAEVDGETSEIRYTLQARTGDPFGGWQSHFRDPKPAPTTEPLRLEPQEGIIKLDSTPGVVIHDPQELPPEFFVGAASGSLSATPSAIGITRAGDFMVSVRRGPVASPRQSIFETWSIDEDNVVDATPTDTVSWDEIYASAGFRKGVAVDPTGRYAVMFQNDPTATVATVMIVVDMFLSQRIATLTLTSVMPDNINFPEFTWVGDYLYWPADTTGELFVFDMSDPAAPSLLDTYSSSLTDIECVVPSPDGQFLYACGGSDSKVISLDISDPSSISEVDDVTGITAMRSIGINEDGTLLFGAKTTSSGVITWVTIDVSGGTLTLNTSSTVADNDDTDGFAVIFHVDRAMTVSDRDSGTGTPNILRNHVYNVEDPTDVTIEEVIDFNNPIAGNIGPAFTKHEDGLKILWTFNSNSDSRVWYGVRDFTVVPLTVEKPLRVEFGGTGIGSYRKGNLIAATAETTLGKVPPPTENGQVLISDDQEETCMRWGQASAANIRYLASGVSALGSGLQNMNDLAIEVEAGKQYTFRAELYFEADASLGHKYAIGGTAVANSVIYQIRSLDDDTGDCSIIVSGQKNALGGAAGQVGALRGFTEIIGFIDVQTGGTLVPQFATQA